MGQKVHPIGFRLGIVKDWKSRWFADKGYAHMALEDAAIREYFKERFARSEAGRGRRDRGRDAGIAGVEIERAANNVRVTLHTAKPGIIIGRGGRGVDDLRADLERLTNRKVHINVQEIRQPELDAQLVAENVASQIEKRVAFKRTVHQAVQRSMRMGAQGIKIICSGRLGGSEMARTYTDKDGKIPLHTLRADIDYGFTEARTTAGHIGIKVWVYRGDILPEKGPARPEVPAEKKERKKRPGWRRVPQEEQAAAPEGEGEGEAAAAEATEGAPAAEATTEPAAEPEPQPEGESVEVEMDDALDYDFEPEEAKPGEMDETDGEYDVDKDE
jgi:small subunit ribosomal protein S3